MTDYRVHWATMPNSGYHTHYFKTMKEAADYATKLTAFNNHNVAIHGFAPITHLGGGGTYTTFAPSRAQL